MAIDNSLESNLFILGDVENMARSWMLVKTSIDEANSLQISPGDGLYIALHVVQNGTTFAARKKFLFDVYSGCLRSNCDETIRIIALDDTQALSVLLLSMLPGISGIKSPTMDVCFHGPMYLEVVVVVNLMESGIVLKESIRPTIPFIGRFSILLQWDHYGSIGRCERFGNADIARTMSHRFGIRVPFHWCKVYSQNNRVQ